MNRLEIRRPFAEVFLSIVQYLTCLMSMLEFRAGVARYNWGIVEKVQQAAAVAGEHYLLFSTFDGGGEVKVVGFLELLACLREYVNMSVP